MINISKQRIEVIASGVQAGHRERLNPKTGEIVPYDFSMERHFEGQMLIVPYGSVLSVVRSEDGKIHAHCRKTGWFTERAILPNIEALKVWLNRLLGVDKN